MTQCQSGKTGFEDSGAKHCAWPRSRWQRLPYSHSSFRLRSLAQAAGEVRLKIAKAGMLVGASAGSGVLTYRGRDYPFRVYGVGLGVTAGASVGEFEGWASGIREVRDFAGTYSSVGAGGTLVGGVGGVRLHNDKGVTIELHGTTAGMEFAANVSKIRVSLK